MNKEPENLVLELLRNIRADIARLDDKIGVKVDGAKSALRSEMNELRSEMNSLRADVAADFLALRKETGEQIQGNRLKIRVTNGRRAEFVVIL